MAFAVSPLHCRCWASSGVRCRRVHALASSASPPGAIPPELGSTGRRRVDNSEELEANAYTPVSSYSSQELISFTPLTPLSDALPAFSRVTGVPVLDSDGKPVGVLSEKDVLAFFAQHGETPESFATPVERLMTSPAICIREDSHVAYAAGLMLQHKVHRLPVVTRTGECVGMLTRGDVFKPLVPGFTATSVTTPEKKARGEAYAAIKAKLDRMRSTRLQASE